MPRKTVYIDTSVVSYLTAWPTTDLLATAWRTITAEWWETQRGRFHLRTSDIAIDEAGKGDPEAAERKLATLRGILVLAVTEAADELSERLVQEGAIPAKAVNDALHVAVSAVHAVDYLLTWNFLHLDNAETKPVMRSVCARYGHACPEICPPRALVRNGKMSDEVIKELWRVKDDIAREHGYDVDRFAAYLQSR